MNVFHLGPATSSDHSRIFITAPTPRSHKELPLEEISAGRILYHHVGPAGRSRSVTGRKGKLGIAADIFSVVVVEVKKSSGDTLEYNQFCSKELRPALKDIVWTGNFVPA
ncbi:hypothetical protein SASPL_129860 [Salvia splendens]|uniref:Uncharacterized protein n=1 Tax=Salvia splendens TaxID=180675 RepID=A0A8X8ZP61_SALSN|nr:hypothetical protein SASPL_129860 [Salvia splendens]